jgi:hypothetical protein
VLDLEVGTTPLVYCIIMKVENILASVIFSVGNLLISIFRMLHYSINKLSLHIIRNINKLFTYTIGYNLLSLCIVDVGRAIHVNNIYIQVCTYQKLSYMIQSRVGDYIRIHWARSH